MNARIALALVLALFAHVCPALEWQGKSDTLQSIPALTARVVDTTQTLSGDEKQALEGRLAEWESRTGNQLVVLIVPTTQPEPIESYSLRAAEAWKIGRRGQDNGAIFVIAKNDKKMRIEVGYGLEGTLTDVTAHRIITETVAPLFSKGQFGPGISAGVDRIMQVVGSGEPLATKGDAQKRDRGGIDFGTLLILLLVVVPFVGGVLQRMFGKLLGSSVGGGLIGFAAWMIAGSLAIAVLAGIVAFVVMIFSGIASGLGRRGGVYMPGSTWGGGWGGGGWSGGGGGGGFSGGGGSFGGGGASGGWN